MVLMSSDEGHKMAFSLQDKVKGLVRQFENWSYLLSYRELGEDKYDSAAHSLLA